MERKVYKVKGMHCASCAATIEKKVGSLSGVKSVSVNYGNETARIAFDPAKAGIEEMNAEIGKVGYSLVSKDEKPAAGHDHAEMELGALRAKVGFAMPVTIVVFLAMLWDIASRASSSIPRLPVSESFDALMLVVSTVVMFWIGRQFIEGVWRFIRHGAANMDTLIGIGTLTAYIYSASVVLLPGFKESFRLPDFTFFDVTIVVIGFVMLGKYLESRSKKKTGDAIEKLLGLQAKTAIVIRGGKEIDVPVSDVVHGDVIVIKPAGKIPVDGVVLDGESFVDESMISGEPVPVEKKKGDTVVAGTINTSGAFTFTATKVGKETMLAHIVEMVEEAQGSKAPIQALADKISAVFVPIVLALSFISLGLWLSVGTSYLGFSQALSFGLVSFVGILVIACPCALGLATPTAIIVGVGKGAREGILVKDAAALETLHKATVVVMDKTGTITRGKPEFVSLKNMSGRSDEEMISVLASLENKSEHPIAHAIVSYAKERKLALKDAQRFEAMKGKGLRGAVDGIEYYAGSPKMASELGISFDPSTLSKDAAEGRTPVLLATREKVLAVAFVADKIKPEAKYAVLRLHKLGIKTVMLTGDNAQAARSIALEAGIDEVVAEVLPEDKLKKIQELQSKGEIVAMAGDGVNDAPALAQADVGIAMATGTDVAIESAGVTLLHGDIGKLVKAIRLSKMTMRGIKQNLFWAFVYNIVGIPLAGGLLYPFFGWLLSPVFAGLAMAFSSVSVVGNSLRLRTKKL